MTLSHRERHILSTMDEELAADPRLCAVADLFAQPPPSQSGSVSDGRPRGRWASASPAVVTLLGLVCCALTAALGIPVVASAGAVLAVVAAMAFAVVVIHRRTRATTAATGTDRAPATLTAGGDDFRA